MRACEFINEHTLAEGRWNEEFLKNLIRAAVAAVAVYGGLEAKRLSTPLDKPALDSMVQQLQVQGPQKLAKIVKKARDTKRVDAADKMYLDDLIGKAIK